MHQMEEQNKMCDRQINTGEKPGINRAFKKKWLVPVQFFFRNKKKHILIHKRDTEFMQQRRDSVPQLRTPELISRLALAWATSFSATIFAPAKVKFKTVARPHIHTHKGDRS